MEMILSAHSENDLNMSNETLSANISCEIQQIQGSPLPLSPTTTDVVKYTQAALYIGGFPVSLFLNIYLFAVVAKFKILQNLSFCLILQIIATDFIHLVVLFPVVVTNILVDGWAFGQDMCPVIGMMILWTRILRSFLMVVLTSDRLCSVFMPFWYARHRVKIIVPLSVVAWLASFLIALVGVPGMLDCFGFQRFTWWCSLNSGCKNQSSCDSYRNFTVSVTVLSLFVALLMYVALYIKAKKLNRVVLPSSLSSTSDNHSSTTNIGNIVTGEQVSSDSASTMEPSCNARLKKVAHERRATVTFLFLFLALFGVVFPAFLFLILGPQILKHLQIQRPPSTYIVFAIISRSLFSTIAIIDPLTLMRDADVRKVNTKLIKQFKQAIAKKLH